MRTLSDVNSLITMLQDPSNMSHLMVRDEFGKHFVPQRELFDEQALHPITDQSGSFAADKNLAPRELSKRVNPSTSASGSKPSGVKALCFVCNECLFDANHAMCLIDHVNSMNVRAKSASKKNKKRKEWKPTGKVFNYVGYKWKPTGRTFTLVGNACPLTRLTATNKVPLRVPIPLEVVVLKQVVTRVYTRRPKVPKSVQNSKPKVAKSMTANKMEPDTSRGFNTSVAPSSFSS
ncbi:hypothetical protein Tco_1547327 [Tanacetum coccineum]